MRYDLDAECTVLSVLPACPHAVIGPLCQDAKFYLSCSAQSSCLIRSDRSALDNQTISSRVLSFICRPVKYLPFSPQRRTSCVKSVSCAFRHLHFPSIQRK